MIDVFCTDKPGLSCLHMGPHAHDGITQHLLSMHTGASHEHGSMFILSAGLAAEHGSCGM